MKVKLNVKIFILSTSLIMLLGLALYNYYFKFNSNEIAILKYEAQEIKRKPKDPGGIIVPNSDSLVYDQLKKQQVKTLKEDIKFASGPEKVLRLLNDISSAESANIYQEDAISKFDNYDKSPLQYQQESFIDKISQVNVTLGYDNPEYALEFDDEDYTHYNGEVYLLQLKAVSSKQSADLAWSNIQNKYKKILGNHELIIKKVESDNGIMFLVTTGPFSNYLDAKLICTKLKNLGQNCIIIKYGTINKTIKQ